MDAMDNRNFALLSRVFDEHPKDRTPSAHPRNWGSEFLANVLLAMRKAGDEALLDQVTVRLERSFGSTRDVRAGAALVAE